MPFSTVQRVMCLLLNIIFERGRMNQLNRRIRCTFLLLLYQINQPFSDFKINGAASQSFYEYVKTG
jgi:hypothetical protein